DSFLRASAVEIAAMRTAEKGWKQPIEHDTKQNLIGTPLFPPAAEQSPKPEPPPQIGRLGHKHVMAVRSLEVDPMAGNPRRGLFRRNDNPAAPGYMRIRVGLFFFRHRFSQCQPNNKRSQNLCHRPDGGWILRTPPSGYRNSSERRALGAAGRLILGGS